MGDICNIGGTGMKIGDTLYCLDGSTVTLCYYDSEIIIVEYMGKRYKRPYSVLGKKLFISPVNLGKVCSPSIYDQDGYDKDGFDRDGYNKKGYDRQGYPRPNMTVPKHVPYDQDGFDSLYDIFRTNNRASIASGYTPAAGPGGSPDPL